MRASRHLVCPTPSVGRAFSGSLALVVVSGISRSVGSDYSNSFSLPKTESSDAIQLLRRRRPRCRAMSIRSSSRPRGARTVTDPSVEARINAMLAKVAKVPHVTEHRLALRARGRQPHQQGQPDRLRHRDVRQAGPESLHGRRHRPGQHGQVGRSAGTAGGGVRPAGEEPSSRPSVEPGSACCWPPIVLFLVFASFFAMILPLVSALASLGTAVGLIGLLSNVMKMPEFSTTLVLLIGLGVGIDYALFIVTRHRQGLIAGQDPETSIVNAVNTSGRAVLFAGIIVCIALLGMFALGVSFLYGLAVAAALGVALTMIAALTLLPALLGFIGPKVLSAARSPIWPRTGPASSAPAPRASGHAGPIPSGAARSCRRPWP